jgi:hypothetical protein
MKQTNHHLILFFSLSLSLSLSQESKFKILIHDSGLLFEGKSVSLSDENTIDEK